MRRMIVPVLVMAFLSGAAAVAAPRKQVRSDGEKVGKKEAIEWLQNSFMKTTYRTFVSKPYGAEGKTFSVRTLPRRFEEVSQCVVVLETKVTFSGSITGDQFESREVDLGALNPNVAVKTKTRQAATDVTEAVLAYDVVAYTYQLRPVVRNRVVAKKWDDTDFVQEDLESEIRFSFSDRDLVDRTARALRIAIEGCGGKHEGF